MLHRDPVPRSTRRAVRALRVLCSNGDHAHEEPDYPLRPAVVQNALARLCSCSSPRLCHRRPSMCRSPSRRRRIAGVHAARSSRPGYIWTPGYWAYGPEGYYWVPGTWVLAPYVGALWTPGYWGWGSGASFGTPGTGGPHVGFYGGVNYGFGYIGVGYHGGYWNGGVFNYNSAVTNVNVTNIHNTYNNPVAQNYLVVPRELQRRCRRRHRPADLGGAARRARPHAGNAVADKT